MMVYSLEIKNEAKERMKKSEKISDISKKMGISVSTLYKWRKDIQLEEEQKEKGESELIKTSKQIKQLTEENNFEDAIVLCDKFPNNSVIQSQKIKILIKMERYDEARKIGNREEFKDNTPIKSQMIYIATKQGEEKQQFLNRIKTKLYYDKIKPEDIEEIKNSGEISEYERNCMLLAIYEKAKNVQKAKQLVKEYKKENPNSKDVKIFNIILQRIESKKNKIFDYSLYDQIINWNFDAELKQKYEEQIRQESDKKREQAKEQRNESVKAQNIATRINKKTSQRTTMETSKTTEKDAKKQMFKKELKTDAISKSTISQENRKKEPTHYNEIVEFLKEKRQDIYVRLQSKNLDIQKKAQEQWDKMEVLMEKVTNSREDKKYLNNLYQKIVVLKEKEEEIER